MPILISMYTCFYDIIDEIRKHFKMSEYAIAKKLDMKQSVLSHWRNRGTAKPHPHTLAKIEQSLGVKFMLDDDGVPVGWEIAKYTEPEGVEETGMEDEERQDKESHAVTPQETFLDLNFWGGKFHFDGLTRQQRIELEELTHRFKISAQEILQEYEYDLREAELKRDRAMKNATAQYHAKFTDVVLRTPPKIEEE